MSAFLQVIALCGAGLVLAAYLALQRGWWTSTGLDYLWSNFVGALLLTVVAVADQRFGFIALESIWALVSLSSIVRHQATASRRS
jgi:hypothetical protein